MSSHETSPDETSPGEPSPDETLRAVFDPLLAGLRAPLEASFRAYAEKLERAAAAEQARAVRDAAEASAAEVRREGLAQMSALLTAARQATETELAVARAAAEREMAALRQNTDAEIALVRQKAEREVAAARERAHADIEDARRTAMAQVEDVQRAMDERLAAMQPSLEESHRTLLEESHRSVEQMRRALEVKERDVEDARLELEQARRVLEQAGRGLEAVRAEMADVRARTAAEAREFVATQLAAAAETHQRSIADAVGRVRDEWHDAEIVHAREFLNAIRALDEAPSLGEVLERLTQFAGREGERAAVLVVRGERLLEWRAFGFGDPAGRIELACADAGLAGEAVRTGRAAMYVGTDGQRLPRFAAGRGARASVALPVMVGGAVVAILYADAPAPDPPAERQWASMIEVLARHASRVLGAMTVERAVGLWSGPAARAAPPADGRSHSGSVQ